MNLIIDGLVFLIGVLIVWATMLSAIRTLILPRSVQDGLVWFVFITLRRVFEWRIRRAKTYREKDRIFSFYSPVSLLLLLPFWLTTTLIGFMLMNWATGIQPWSEAFTVSGSSLLTLGFAKGETLIHTILAFVESTLGLILIALLIAYLPTMYNAFSKREQAVTLLETRAGSPPAAIEILLRAHRIMGLDAMDDFWRSWENWFADIEESHTSLPALVFFRSPQPNRSWVTASGAVLDAAALYLSILDMPFNPQAALCIRSGYLALRRISDVFRITYSPGSQFPKDPISISREEFSQIYDQLADQGLPTKRDREQAWQDFGGWRVNYDQVLLALCVVTMAPKAPWSSDRVPDNAGQLMVSQATKDV